ncbi:MAG: arginine--tRNA ligase [Synergistaceae bacterium]|nr:arginine--tRNA ligase [Synergistota bacterium]NLM72320.1 arginine--tRNA ligase [Synergistaceae bacterium]
MADVTLVLKTIVEDALRVVASEKGLSEAAIPEVAFERPKRDGQGDWSTNCAMKLCKLFGERPMSLADRLAGLIPLGGYLDRVETAAPGFINFFLSSKWMEDALLEIFDEKENYGSSNLGEGRRVQIEFVSANPTGPLHIGHGRGAAVGDIISSILSFTGWTAEREYYINDAGLQMDLLGASVQSRYFELSGSPESAPFPEDGYRGDYIYDIARAVMEREGNRYASLPASDSLPFFKSFAAESILDTIRSDLSDFGVEFDVWFSENSLYERDLVPQAMNRLKERGFAFEKDGALWFKSSDSEDEKDRVLIRSSGVPTYFASDIAYHKEKFDRGFDKVIDVWGADHHGYVPRMKAGVEALGRPPEDLQVLLIQFVNLLRGGEQVGMSTRSGQFVTLRDVMDEVGVDATRFFFVMRRSDSHLDFDLELAKQSSNENPVYYVQYAHARICSVIREAESRGIPLPGVEELDMDAFSLDEEKRLMARLAAYPKEVEKASRELAPHVLVTYALDLAGDFHSFYNACRILGSEDPVMKSRILLVRASGTVLASALSLLGVSAPERM